MSKTTDSISTTCVLCCQEAKLFAIGPCDHPICSKCSTRMRVLCEQKYCSVCRNDMKTVIFVKKVHPFASIISHKYLYDKKTGIRFSAGWMKNEFEDYLCHKCSICPKDTGKFKTIKALEEHMRRNHELHYCNLCLENVKVFTSERALYTRRDLAVHKRKGDPDNKSYRGHPLCEFCDVRFFDNDELLKHLRRQHYFCHFCENDGISNQYYDVYENLRHHFREQHYLCEEDSCINEEFTAAFRTEIDLKAHKAAKHISKLSRKEAKQARQLDWEFNYTNPRASHRDGVVTGADYHETQGSYRGRGRGSRYNSNREYTRDTERAIEASMQPDTSKEQRPPKRRDKPRIEKTEKAKLNDKPLGKKERSVKEDEFEKRRATTNDISGRKLKGHEPNSGSNNSVTEITDWSTGNSLTNCQFNESTWTNDGEKSPKVNKSVKNLEENLVKEISATSKKNEQKSVHLQESDFPSLGVSLADSASAILPHWKREVPCESEFPSLGAAAKPHKIKTPQNSSLNSTSVSKEAQLKVDFSKAIAANAMLHNKKKSSFNQPTPQPPSTTSHNDFPTLSSIANFLNPEPQQAWGKSKPPSKVEKNPEKTSNQSRFVKLQPANQQKARSTAAEKSKPSTNLKQENSSKPKSSVTEGSNAKDSLKNSIVDETKKKRDSINDKNLKETMKAKDVPKNSVMNTDSQKNAVPPGFQDRKPPGITTPSVPPPGFSTLPDSKAPPGFSGTSEFIKPNNFQQRNKDLVDQIQSYLNYDPEGFNEFKRLSNQFRQGFLSADVYYKSCSALLGQDNFQGVFPNLVALLPDTVKQQELLLVNNDFKICAKEKAEKVMSIKKKGIKLTAWNSSSNKNTKCNTCGQVLLEKDLVSHTNVCSTNAADFPSLSAASSSAAPRQSSAWGRVK